MTEKEIQSSPKSPAALSWRLCRGATGTEGLSPSALGSLQMEADGEVCGQLETDEETAKWMRDSKPGEQKIKCLSSLGGI